MNSQPPNLTPLEQSLLCCAPGKPTWRELTGEIESLPTHYASPSWPDFIPENLISVWGQLSLETRVVAYVLAYALADGAFIE